ncbi:MAG TPA: DUF4382 domain-containing protein [Bacteriovoracaceae bacterium]|nr:DUF4382 domain-containing protein [Bacteriovoracaceae bacterium]
MIIRQTLTLACLMSFSSCGLEKVTRYLTKVKTSQPYKLELYDQNANFRLIATDAPFSYDYVTKAELTVSSVLVGDSNGIYKELLKKSRQIDILTLRNGNVSLLSEATLAPGKYREIKVSFSTATVHLKDGRIFNLSVPQSALSGISVPIGPVLEVAPTATPSSATPKVTDLLVDFDLSRSFLPTGDTSAVEKVTGFTFFPVLRTADVALCGVVAGVVISDNGTPVNPLDDKKVLGAIAEISQGSSSFTAITDEDGVYQFIGVQHGKYTVKVKAIGHTVGQPQEVEVRKEELSTLRTYLVKN